MTPQEFRNKVLGKRFDIDGYYGSQCWDGYAYYMKQLGYKYANCTSSGYVKDIWENRKTNGMLDSCIEVTVMQQGDICVFRAGNSWTPLSHIAIFMKDLGNGYGLFLGQNQGGKDGAFNEVKLPYNITYDTAFRPKCFKDLFASKPQPSSPATNILNVIPNDFRYEKATFTVNVDEIKIRRSPSLSGADTGLVYKKGMSVVYDGYVVREGYIWISWISSSDKTRRWMACGRTNAAGRNIEPWGTFK